MFDIEFYTLPDGRKPVEEFLDSLPIKMRIKAIDSLDLLEQYGNQLRMPYSKALNDGLFELRIKFPVISPESSTSSMLVTRLL